jgi:hypothetical protein
MVPDKMEKRTKAKVFDAFMATTTKVARSVDR